MMKNKIRKNIISAVIIGQKKADGSRVNYRFHCIQVTVAI